jgi:TM2 domain-containing membrane protein YozV
MSDVQNFQEVQKAGPDEKYCSSCGSIIKKEAVICPKCGVQQKNMDGDGEVSSKWLTVLLLHIFLGIFGAHYFYVGKTSKGILMLVLTIGGIATIFVFVGFAAIVVVMIFWVLDLIKILTGKFTDAKGRVISKSR